MNTFLIIDDDLVIKDGQFEMIDDIDEICQSIERILTTRKTEFFLNLDHGLEHSEFHNKAFDFETLRFDIIEAISQDERVSFVKSVKFNNTSINRKLSVNIIVVLKALQEIEINEVNL